MEIKPKTSNCENHHCCKSNYSNSSVSQTLDEMDFERGIWYAAQNGDLARVEYLLGVKGISPNARDLSGYVALHYSARGGHIDVCKLLIKCGADVNLTTRAGKATPLQRAAACGQVAIIRLLLGMEKGYPCKSDITARDGDGNTALHKAVQGGHEQVIGLLLEVSPNLLTISNNKGLLAREYATTSNIKKMFQEEDAA